MSYFLPTCSCAQRSYELNPPEIESLTLNTPQLVESRFVRDELCLSFDWLYSMSLFMTVQPRCHSWFIVSHPASAATAMSAAAYVFVTLTFLLKVAGHQGSRRWCHIYPDALH